MFMSTEHVVGAGGHVMLCGFRRHAVFYGSKPGSRNVFVRGPHKLHTTVEGRTSYVMLLFRDMFRSTQINKIFVNILFIHF